MVLKLIKEETTKFADRDPRRVFIGGFSQGCMVSLAAFLKYTGPEPFGGILGLSGMQALTLKPEHQTSERIAVQKQIPIFLYHGEADPLLPIKNVNLTYKYILDTFKGELLSFDTEKGLTHSLSDREMALIKYWLGDTMEEREETGMG